MFGTWNGGHMMVHIVSGSGTYFIPFCLLMYIVGEITVSMEELIARFRQIYLFFLHQLKWKHVIFGMPFICMYLHLSNS
jgi:hypothetical protein